MARRTVRARTPAGMAGRPARTGGVVTVAGEVGFEHVKVVAILEVLQQRTVGNYSAADDLDRDRGVLAVKLLLQPPTKRLFVSDFESERERITQ